MNARTNLPPAALEDFRAAIARSPIVFCGRSLQARLADWSQTRHSPDVDEVILAWLASQAGPRHLDA